MTKCNTQIDLDLWNKMVSEMQAHLDSLLETKKQTDRNTDPRDQSDNKWPNPSIKSAKDALDNLKKHRDLAKERADNCPCGKP